MIQIVLVWSTLSLSDPYFGEANENKCIINMDMVDIWYIQKMYKLVFV